MEENNNEEVKNVNVVENENKTNNEEIKRESKKRRIYIIITIVFLFLSIFSIIVTTKIIDSIQIKYVQMDAKPIIYLYPTSETEVNVELGLPEQITCSYPKYEDNWNVIAKPNGDLTYTKTGRNLYSLYYESEKVQNSKVEKEGFVVKAEDTAKFLEEKLAILGLNEREAEEFIVYWLPKLEANKYNYIRFESKEEIEENMPLNITPTPDTIIRVMMDYKGLEKPIQIEEQKLETTERNGFVAVEWGGTEIK